MLPCLFQPNIDFNPSEPEDIRGTLHLTLNYDVNAGILSVRLIEVSFYLLSKRIWLIYIKRYQAQDLQPRDFSGTADPYAKVRLLPDRANVWQTRIHKRTLNPGKLYHA